MTRNLLFLPLVLLALIFPSTTGSPEDEAPSWAFPASGVFVPYSISVNNEADFNEYVSKQLGLLPDENDVSKRGSVPDGEHSL